MNATPTPAGVWAAHRANTLVTGLVITGLTLALPGIAAGALGRWDVAGPLLLMAGPCFFIAFPVIWLRDGIVARLDPEVPDDVPADTTGTAAPRHENLRRWGRWLSVVFFLAVEAYALKGGYSAWQEYLRLSAPFDPGVSPYSCHPAGCFAESRAFVSLLEATTWGMLAVTVVVVIVKLTLFNGDESEETQR